MQPVAQAILLESFTPAKRGAAMAAFALGVVCAPIIGPTLGGWITDNYSWRWIFYINIPVGALAIFMVMTFVEDPPWILNATTGRIDVTGFALMALGLGLIQIILDKGQQDDWFEAEWIRWSTAAMAFSLVAFVIWELRVAEPIVNLRILANRNFAIGTFLITALDSGMAISPRGIGSIVLLPVIGKLSGKIDNRYMLTAGFLLLATSTFMLGRITLQVDMWSFVIPNIIGGMALALLFVPLTTQTMGMLRNEQIGNASGIYNLMRNIGGSIGISLVAMLVARHAHAAQAMMVSHLTPYDLAYQQRIAALQPYFTARYGPYLGQRMAERSIYNALLSQASLVSFVDNFRLFGFLCLMCIPLVFIFKRVRHGPGPAAGVH